MIHNNLESSVKELKHSVDRINKRIDSWWKIFWYGALQGAGAVVGAALIVGILGLLINIIDVTPYLGDKVNEVRQLLEKSR